MELQVGRNRHLEHMEHGDCQIESLVMLHKGHQAFAEDGDEFSRIAKMEIAKQLADLGLYVDH